jgi:hypothetical protein
MDWEVWWNLKDEDDQEDDEERKEARVGSLDRQTKDACAQHRGDGHKEALREGRDFVRFFFYALAISYLFSWAEALRSSQT